jgi:hypothetical protein
MEGAAIREYITRTFAGSKPSMPRAAAFSSTAAITSYGAKDESGTPEQE